MESFLRNANIMDNNKLIKFITVVSLGVFAAAVVILTSMFTASGAQAAPANDAAPVVRALTRANTAYTADFTLPSASGASWLWYGTADIYVGLDLSDTQTVTVKVQASPDGVSWTDEYTLFEDQTTDAITHTRLSAIGAMYRISTTVANTNTFHVSKAFITLKPQSP